MKHLGLFFVALLGAVMPSMAWDATYQDPVSGIVYSYFYNDNVASVAAGTRPGGESDVFNQTLVFHNTIQSEAVILSSFEVNGKTYTVTAIDDYAFAYLTTLTQITIPKSVTRIGDMAFGECSALTDVYCYANPNKLK